MLLLNVYFSNIYMNITGFDSAHLPTQLEKSNLRQDVAVFCYNANPNCLLEMHV